MTPGGNTEDDLRPPPGNTLSVILYRLKTIEQNTTGLVRYDTYELAHKNLSRRVAVLEEQRDNDRKHARTFAVAVTVALMVPVLTNLSSIIDALGGIT